MSAITQQVTERIIGGVLAPIVIMLVAVWSGVHTHGYLPVWLTPVVLVITLVGTDQYRRPNASRAR